MNKRNYFYRPLYNSDIILREQKNFVDEDRAFKKTYFLT